MTRVVKMELYLNKESVAGFSLCILVFLKQLFEKVFSKAWKIPSRRKRPKPELPQLFQKRGSTTDISFRNLQNFLGCIFSETSRPLLDCFWLWHIYSRILNSVTLLSERCCFYLVDIICNPSIIVSTQIFVNKSVVKWIIIKLPRKIQNFKILS